MKKIMKRICFVLTILTISFFIIYKINHSSLIYTLLITFFTTTYHFDMRLLVGYLVDAFMHNQADYNKKWYQIKKREKLFYEIIKIKKWKEYMPTYSPDHFDIKKHSLEDIIQVMCQAEIVHEVIFVLSYVPLLFIIYFDTAVIFIKPFIKEPPPVKIAPFSMISALNKNIE